jgi:cystathionine beta-lyase family protein involved in aluminum resistance
VNNNSNYQDLWLQVTPYIERLKTTWNQIDRVVLTNQARILDAFTKEHVAANHLWPSTGYGYGDAGRTALERVYARTFGAEAALVRPHWASGTHALKSALFAMLRPGDEALSLTGIPYDTLIPVIGISRENSAGNREEGSLKDFDISFRFTDALSHYVQGDMTLRTAIEEIKQAVGDRTSLLYLQRSRGYSQKKAVSMDHLAKFIPALRTEISIPIMVDNCYCEFVEEHEPPSVGIDLTVGSLIKNPGGGLAPSGGYAVGTRTAVDRVSKSLYAPGIGDEIGSNPSGYRDFFQGLFLAPKVVGESLKGASFASLYFQDLGMKTDPGPFDKRSDIVQCIETGSADALLTLTKAIQGASPIDSFASPEPSLMPGYDHPVVMAAGTFVQGASIELSCDAPFIAPFRAYLQGGLTKEHVILACLRAGTKLKNIS